MPACATAHNGFPISPVGGQVPHEIWWKGNRPCTQAGQALPLALGLVPEEQRPAVGKEKEKGSTHNIVRLLS